MVRHRFGAYFDEGFERVDGRDADQGGRQFHLKRPGIDVGEPLRLIGVSFKIKPGNWDSSLGKGLEYRPLDHHGRAARTLERFTSPVNGDQRSPTCSVKLSIGNVACEAQDNSCNILREGGERLLNF
jgi:hypothetical protein